MAGLSPNWHTPNVRSHQERSFRTPEMLRYQGLLTARSGRSGTKSECPLMVAGVRFSKYTQIEIEPFPLVA
jgi:hypothetical protein